MSGFLIKDVDKFEDKTTTTTEMLKLSSVKIKLRHISFADGDDSLVIDVYSERQYGWLNIRGGELILNINYSINIRLEAHENYTNSSSFKNNDGEVITTYSESAFYNITKEQFAEICEAKTLDIKVRGSDGSIIESGGVFLIYCKKFYNLFYDNTKYLETQDIEEFRGENNYGKYLIGPVILILIVIVMMIVFFSLIFD